MGARMARRVADAAQLVTAVERVLASIRRAMGPTIDLRGDVGFVRPRSQQSVLMPELLERRWLLSQAPYSPGLPWTVTGVIQAENFDAGGQSVAYHDTTTGNAGGVYRTGEDVDLVSTFDGGSGFAVNGTKGGEWLEYTLDVLKTGSYTLATRVANVGTGGSFHVEFNGVNKSGAVAVPNTGSQTTYQDVTTTNISLDAGQHVMRVVFDAESATSGIAGTFNRFTLTSLPDVPSGVTATPANHAAVNIHWTDVADNESGYKVYQSTNGGAYTLLTSTALGANTTNYLVNNLTAGANYAFRVRATNAAGDSADSASAAVTMPTIVPDAPAGLIATASSSTQVALNWIDATDNETAYVVERSSDGQNFTTLTSTLSAGTTSHNVTSGLTPGQTYQFRVRARNAAGDSTNSNLATVTMPLLTAPTLQSLAVVSSTQINLSWQDATNANETGYRIEVSTDGGATFSETGSAGANATAFNAAGLTAGTAYWFRVRATINGTSFSPYSAVLSARTSVLPMAPTNLVAVPAGNAAITLLWEDNAQGETGVRIERSTDGVNFQEIATAAAANQSYAATALSPGATYHFRVRAYNTENSPYSNTVTIVAPAIPPSAPEALTATPITSTRIDLTWRDNASNESGYKVERSTDGTNYTLLTTTAANATTYSVTSGLSLGTTYYFRVRATNTGGDSANSDVASAAPVSLAAPINLFATYNSSTAVNLNWSFNGSGQSGFKIEQSVDGGVTFTYVTTTTSTARNYAVSGLTTSQTFHFRVRATNASGDSLNSNTAIATPALANPTVTTATANSSTQITVGWTYNNTGNSGFKVEQSTDGVSFTHLTTINAAGVRSHPVTGLSPNTRYWFRVRAFSATTDSGYGSPASNWTAAVPAAPLNLTARGSTNTTTTFAWTDVSDNETGFRIERSLDNGATYSLVATTPANARSYAITGLTPGQTNYFRVTAVTAAASNSSASVTTSAMTRSIVPSAPVGLTAARAGANPDTQIVLTWFRVADNETAYKVERSTNGVDFTEVVANLAATSTTYTATGLVRGTPYWFRVRATNAVGNSAYSNVATVVTAPVIAPTLIAAAMASPTQVNLTWNQTSGNENGFRVERSDDGGTTFTSAGTVGVNVTSYNVTGLTPGAVYSFRVVATSTLGDSTPSNVLRARTYTSPSTPAALTASPASNTAINLAWTDATTNETGYRVERSTNGTTFTEIASLAAGVTRYPVTGLAPGQTYYFRIRAANGAFSAYSSTASATTTLLLPTRPTRLLATVVSSSQVNLSWTDNAQREDGFAIDRSTDGINFSQIATVGAGATTYNNTGLSGGTSYYYRVRAYNGAGNSEPTNVATVLTRPATPALTLTPLSATSMGLSWTNVAGEAGYRIERSLNGSTYSPLVTVGADVIAHTDTGLTEGTRYYYRITAYNSSGDGSSAAQNRFTQPNAPTNLVTTVVSGTQINLTWTDNSAKESYYVVQRSTDGLNFTTLTGTLAANSTSYSATGLTAGTTYHFRVMARVTTTGATPTDSNPSNTSPTVTIPATPTWRTTDPIMAVSPSRLDLFWNDVTGETEYRIERSLTNDAASFVQVGMVSAATSSPVVCQDTGLIASTTYYYRIVAANAGGASAVSQVRSMMTQSANAVAPPTNLAATSVTPTQVTLSWTDNPTNEDWYSVERRTGIDGPWEFLRSPAPPHVTAPGNPLPENAVTFQDTTVVEGQAYEYRVRAGNGYEMSGYSNVVSMTIPAGVPAAPTSLVATQVSSTTVKLTWADGSAPGVTPNEDRFVIESSGDAGTTWATLDTVGAGAADYAANNLTLGSTYMFRVYAVNDGAAPSAASNTVSITLADVPGSPGSLTAVAAGASDVNLSWSASSGVVSGYRVDRTVGYGGGYAPVATVIDATTFADTGLSPGTEYAYRIVAFNSVGYSAPSNTVSATTADVPATPGNLAATSTATTVSLTWSDVATETGYELERQQVGSATWTTLGTIATDTTSYTDTAVASDTEYFYRLRATNAVGASAHTPVVHVVVGGSVKLDVDIDSDNTSFDSPQRDGAEEQIEQAGTGPGKVIVVGDSDVDQDGVTDLADGYNRDTTPGATLDDAVAGLVFVPLVISLPSGVSVSTASLAITYSGSDPAGGSSTSAGYTPASGSLRIWTNGGAAGRTVRGITTRNLSDPADDALGFYVPAATYSGEDLTRLGFASPGQSVTFYVEAIRPSDVGALTITVTVDPDGAEPTPALDSRSVHVTAVQAAPASFRDAAGTPWDVAPGADGGDSTGSGYSGVVRYADGSVTYTSSDLDPAGAALVSGHTRTWTTRGDLAWTGVGRANGNGTFVSQRPQLVQATGAVAIVTGGRATRWFDFDGSDYRPRFSGEESLDSTINGFTFTDSAGNRTFFHGFGPSVSPPLHGQVEHHEDVGGNVTVFSYDAESGRLSTIERRVLGTTQVLERLTYAYDANGRLLIASMQRTINGSLTFVRGVAYEYYPVDSAVGRSGDLKFATIYDGDDGIVDRKFYRYDAAGRLRFVLEGSSFERLLGDDVIGITDPSSVADPSVLSDANLAKYADLALTYHTSGPDAGRVATQTIQGAGTYQYTYATSDRNGMEAWKHKTVETLAGGGQTNTVYTNAAGLVLAARFASDTQDWLSAYRYDTRGRLTAIMRPSALATLDEATGMVAELNASGGLIHRFEYYAPASAEPGAAAGYLRASWLDQAGTFDDVLLEKFEYEARPSGTSYLVDKHVVYRDQTATLPIATSYNYSYHVGTDAVASMTTLLPIVYDTQNGDSTSATPVQASIVEGFDRFGRMTSLLDADGVTHTFSYEDATGAIKTQVLDFGGMNQTTTTQSDGLGRPTLVTDARGNQTAIAYGDRADVKHVVTTALHADAGTVPVDHIFDDRRRGVTWIFALTNNAAQDLVSLSSVVRNEIGQVTATHRYADTQGVAYVPDVGLFALPSAVYSSFYHYDQLGRQDGSKDALGTVTRTTFDALGRSVGTSIGTSGWSDTTLAGNGAWDAASNHVLISLNEYDNSQDGGDSNLTKVTLFPHDGSADRITRTIYDWRNRPILSQAGAGAAAGTHALISAYTYDNLGNVIATHVYDGEGLDIGVNANVPPAALRALTVTQYDDRGRAFRTSVFNVSQTNGGDPLSGLTAEQLASLTPATIATAQGLRTDVWYDERDNIIKARQPGGLVSKIEYDAVGRVTKQSTTDGGGDLGHSDADDVTADIVLEQVRTQYDATGNVTLVTTYQRNHNATETGELTPAIARVSMLANYFDDASRLVTSVNHGNNGNNGDINGDGIWDFARPMNPAARNLDGNGNNGYDGFDPFLRNDVTYDAAGRLWKTTDARNVAHARTYDSLGRVVMEIEAYTGLAQPTTDDVATATSQLNSDRVTVHSYNGNDQVVSTQVRTVRPITGGGVANDWLTTAYFYGVSPTMNGGDADYELAHNGLLRKVTYGMTDNAPGAGGYADQHVNLRYNALGEATLVQQRNGTQHRYTFDALGQVTKDEWYNYGQWLGSGANGQSMDTSTRALEYSYDTLGRPVSMRSINGSLNVANEVTRVYDGLGNLTAEYQAHDGLVNTASTPVVRYVQDYNYASNYARLKYMQYPNGRAVWTGYDDTTLNNAISRPGYLADATYDGSGNVTGAVADHLEDYSYLGLGRVVERKLGDTYWTSYAAPIVNPAKDDADAANLANDVDLYEGLDRFGRVLSHGWGTYTSRAYAYDAGGNLLYADAGTNIDAKWRSEIYHGQGQKAWQAYDKLGRSRGYHRGVLSDADGNGTPDTTTRETIKAFDVPSYWIPQNGASTEIETHYRSQTWDVDGQGSFHRQPSPGNPSDPNYDPGAAPPRVTYQRTLGSSTIPTQQPVDGRVDHFAVFDAWGRLAYKATATAQATGGGTFTYAPAADAPQDVQTYRYDALGRRISEARTVDVGAGPVTRPTVHLYYTAGGTDVLEERLNAQTNASTQYVWSLSGPGMLVAQDSDTDSGTSATDYGKPNAGLDQRLWIKQGPDGSVWEVDDADSMMHEQYLYTPEGQVLVLRWSQYSVTFYDTILGSYHQMTDQNSYSAPNGNADLSTFAARYLWRGGRAEVFAGLSNATGAVVDRFDGLVSFGGGAGEHDTLRGAPVAEDVYAFKHAAGLHSDTTAVNTRLPYNGTSATFSAARTTYGYLPRPDEFVGGNSWLGGWIDTGLMAVGYYGADNAAAVWGGAAEGARGGLSITTNTLTFGGSDAVGLTDSGQYQGAEYAWSRAFATLGREALIAAGTLGVGNYLSATRAGAATLNVLSKAHYGEYGMGVLYATRAAEAGLAVRGISTGVDAVQGGYAAVQAGDPTGYVSMLTGGIATVGGVSGLRTATQGFSLSVSSSTVGTLGGNIRIRGPKTDNRFGHNRMIRQTARQVTARGDEVIAGGRVFDGRVRPEAIIQTPGGFKGRRRPDILARRPDGSIYGVNVGRIDASGQPVLRERLAIQDLNEQAGLEMQFVPYGVGR